MKKLMICVDLTDESLNLYKRELKNFNWSEWDELHFAHGFQTQVYADNFYFVSYPAEDQVESVKSSVKDVLKRFSDELVGKDFKGSVLHRCLLSSTPKDIVKDYAQENGITEMIIGTRGKHGISGLFSSSFAEFMVRHAPCRLLILRDEKRD